VNHSITKNVYIKVSNNLASTVKYGHNNKLLLKEVKFSEFVIFLNSKLNYFKTQGPKEDFTKTL
jgi:hypothetical protein